MFKNKSVLITGGTGSFGKAFVKAILKQQPKRVVIYSRDELKQYEMQQQFNEPQMRYFIGDVRDLERLQRALKGIEYCVHAAALKHVPSSEYNPMECIKTNVHGAQNVINASIDNHVEKVVALSTDKATLPTNLYGATKLAADKLFVAANNIVGEQETRFSIVRYGNVIGSRGSVFPLFQQLVKQGAQELPITDPRMSRFWMTIEQGVEFVMNAFRRMYGGEIFIPKIPSAGIMDIAQAIGPDLATRNVGIRPGEKLDEQLITPHDARFTLEFSDHFVIQPSISFNQHPDYELNALGERGHYVADDFEYLSSTNPDFLNVAQIKALTS